MLKNIQNVTVGQIGKFVISFIVNIAIILFAVSLNAALIFAGVGFLLHLFFWIGWFNHDSAGQRETYEIFGKWQNITAISIFITDLLLILLLVYPLVAVLLD